MTDKVQFEIVTPQQLLLSDDADMVVIPGGDGDFGVLPGHAPLLSTMRPGTIDIFEDDKIVKRIFVEGGFAEVTEERCTVLAQEAMPVEEIVRETVEARLNAARERLEATEVESERRDAGHDIDAAEAMLAAIAGGTSGHH